MPHKQSGFHTLELIAITIVVAITGTVGYLFFTNISKITTSTTVKVNGGGEKQRFAWSYDENARKWTEGTSKPPTCKDPYTFEVTPLDLAIVDAVMMPGSYRGFSYKPHGGFRLNEMSNGETHVRLPTDATLVGLTRYYEGNPAELQYLLTFETDCGIAFRFDHLYTLTPAFQRIADTVPEPKLNDTRTNPENAPDPVAFKSGEVVATKVGFMKTRNYGFDFGVYDYRQRNEISRNTKWAEIHQQYSSLDWYGVCWFDMLPGADATKATQLSEVSINTQKPNLIISDYCPNAKHTTLDFNQGRPVDG